MIDRLNVARPAGANNFSDGLSDDDQSCPQATVRLDGGLPLLWVVAIGLIDSEGRVLISERPKGRSLAGLWEFPGGKIEAGELPEAALIRECKEELDIDIGVGCLTPFSFASHSYADFHLFMPLYLCRRWRGLITAKEGQKLKWVYAKELKDHAMPAADLPLASMLRDFLS